MGGPETVVVLHLAAKHGVTGIEAQTKGGIQHLVDLLAAEQRRYGRGLGGIGTAVGLGEKPPQPPSLDAAHHQGGELTQDRQAGIGKDPGFGIQATQIAQDPAIGGDQRMGEQEAHVGGLLHRTLVPQANVGEGVCHQEGLALQNRLGAELKEIRRYGFLPGLALGTKTHAGPDDPVIGMGRVEKADDADGRTAEVADQGGDVLAAGPQILGWMVTLTTARLNELLQQRAVGGQHGRNPVPIRGKRRVLHR